MNKKIFALVIIAILVVAIAAGIIFFSSQEETVDSRIQNLMARASIGSCLFIYDLSNTP